MVQYAIDTAVFRWTQISSVEQGSLVLQVTSAQKYVPYYGTT